MVVKRCTPLGVPTLKKNIYILGRYFYLFNFDFFFKYVTGFTYETSSRTHVRHFYTIQKSGQNWTQNLKAHNEECAVEWNQMCQEIKIRASEKFTTIFGWDF